MLIKPQVQKGTPAVFELNKTSLAGIPSVSSHPHFSNSAVWLYVVFHYESNESNQSKMVTFHAKSSNPTDVFLLSQKSRGDFILKKIVIIDKDNAPISIVRSIIPNVNALDITFGDDEAAIENVLMTEDGYYLTSEDDQYLSIE
jgi:hypothetical protein